MTFDNRPVGRFCTFLSSACQPESLKKEPALKMICECYPPPALAVDFNLTHRAPRAVSLPHAEIQGLTLALTLPELRSGSPELSGRGLRWRRWPSPKPNATWRKSMRCNLAPGATVLKQHSRRRSLNRTSAPSSCQGILNREFEAQPGTFCKRQLSNVKTSPVHGFLSPTSLFPSQPSYGSPAPAHKRPAVYACAPLFSLPAWPPVARRFRLLPGLHRGTQAFRPSCRKTPRRQPTPCKSPGNLSTPTQSACG